MRARAVLSITLPGLLFAGLLTIPATAQAQTYTVTDGSCNLYGPQAVGTLAKAVELANANPGPDIIEIDPSLSEVVVCKHNPYSDYYVEVYDDLTIKGNGVAIRGAQKFVTIDGDTNPKLCPNRQGKDTFLGLPIAFSAVRQGALVVDNVTMSNVSVVHYGDAGTAATFTNSTFQDLQNMDSRSACNAAYFGGEGSLTLADVQVLSAWQEENRGFRTAFILMTGGSSVVNVTKSTFDSLSGFAILSSESTVDIVSSTFSSAGGLRNQSGSMNVVNSAFFDDYGNGDNNSFYQFQNEVGQMRFSGSTISVSEPFCDLNRCTGPDSGNPTGAQVMPFNVASGKLILEGTAVGGRAVSGSSDVLYVAPGASATADAYTWIQPRSGQDATELKSLLAQPNLLTAAPGLPSSSSQYPENITPLLGTSGDPGKLIDAIPDAGAGGKNTLINPIDNKPITKDLLGNARWDANDKRNIGAIQLTLAPHAAVDATGDKQVTLSWSRPLDPASGPVTGYAVSYQPTSGGSSQRIDITDPGTLKTTISGLTNATTYAFTVVAVNSTGDGPPSNTVNGTPTAPPAPKTPPGPPLNVTAVAGVGEATITWTPPTDPGTDPIIGYGVEGAPGGQTCATTAPTVTCTVTGLTNGTSYTFKVRALNAANWGAWSTPSGPVTPVAPSTSFTISAVPMDGAIKVSYMPVAGADKYNLVWKDGTTTNVVPDLTCATGPCGYLITNLVNGQKYTVRMEAYKNGARLVSSNEIAVTPNGPVVPLNAYYPAPISLQVGRAITAPGILPTTTGNPNNFTEGSTKLPDRLKLNFVTGAISGEPLTPVDGLFPIIAQNAAGQSLTIPVRITVIPHTLTLSYADASGHVGTALSLTPHYSNAIGPVRGYRLSSGALPAGLTLDSTTGVISGTPTAPTAGPVALSVIATDDAGAGTASFTITVDSGAAALTIAYPNAVGHVGKTQSITPTVSGASGTLSYSLTSGTLPAGLTLDPATGVISGTPTAAQGPKAVTVQVTDANATDDVTFTIEVLDHTLSLGYPSSTSDVGEKLKLSPAVSHIIGTPSYSITSGTLPAGLTLDPATGVITGTPTSVTSGPVALTIAVTDAYSTASAPFTLQVTAPTPVVPVVAATLTRDVERLAVLGTVAYANPGDTVTPMFKLTGQDTFTAGVPVTLDANGAFTWSRKVASNKSAQVYFTVGTGTSPTLGAARPTVTVTGSRSGKIATVLGTVRNITSGSPVHPWIKINGGKAIKGATLTVGSDGTFTWTYTAAKGDSVRVKFNVRGIKSDPIVL